MRMHTHSTCLRTTRAHLTHNSTLMRTRTVGSKDTYTTSPVSVHQRFHTAHVVDFDANVKNNIV